MSFQISQPPLLLPPRARGAGAFAWFEPAPFAREREKSISACRFPFPRLFFFFFPSPPSKNRLSCFSFRKLDLMWPG